MTVEEIRGFIEGIDRSHPNGLTAIAQFEIAAQIAELNRKIDSFSVNQSPTFKSLAITLFPAEEIE